MNPPAFWLDLFTGVTWNEFIQAGGTVSGFRESRWATVQKIKPGDYLLCYLTGISRFIGALEVVSPPFKDSTPIWKDEDFPCRLKVRSVVALSPDTAVPVHELRDRLSIFRDLTSALAWTGHVRGSPAKWKLSDGRVVLDALIEAKGNPISRPVDPAKLARRPKALKAKIGSVTVPEGDAVSSAVSEPTKQPTDHAEIQWLLLTLGSDMGFDVWVARHDRTREVRGKKFEELPRLKREL